MRARLEALYYIIIHLEFDFLNGFIVIKRRDSLRGLIVFIVLSYWLLLWNWKCTDV